MQQDTRLASGTLKIWMVQALRRSTERKSLKFDENFVRSEELQQDATIAGTRHSNNNIAARKCAA